MADKDSNQFLSFKEFISQRKYFSCDLAKLNGRETDTDNTNFQIVSLFWNSYLFV